jgi:8-oxo-dGTP pyrophosphatase MutT (NUDIX family)
MPESTKTSTKHYTASVIILSQEKPAKALLLHHRKYDKWSQPGGHQEPWENIYETAIRETKEETGIDITPYMERPKPFDEHATFIPLPNYILEEKIPAHGDQPGHYHIDMNYIIRIPEQAATHDPDEAHHIQWFTREEIKTLPTFEDLRVVLLQELAK